MRWELHQPGHHGGEDEYDPLQRGDLAMAKGIEYRRDGRLLAP